MREARRLGIQGFRDKDIQIIVDDQVPPKKEK
jgi:hypothetical protein